MNENEAADMYMRRLRCSNCYLTEYTNKPCKECESYDNQSCLDSPIDIMSIHSLHFISLLVDRCETTRELAYIAAGPLEDILSSISENDLDCALQKSEKMRRALEGVWASNGTEKRAMLDRLLLKYGLNYGHL